MTRTVREAARCSEIRTPGTQGRNLADQKLTALAQSSECWGISRKAENSQK